MASLMTGTSWGIVNTALALECSSCLESSPENVHYHKTKRARLRNMFTCNSKHIQYVTCSSDEIFKIKWKLISTPVSIFNLVTGLHINRFATWNLFRYYKSNRAVPIVRVLKCRRNTLIRMFLSSWTYFVNARRYTSKTFFRSCKLYLLCTPDLTL